MPALAESSDGATTHTRTLKLGLIVAKPLRSASRQIAFHKIAVGRIAFVTLVPTGLDGMVDGQRVRRSTSSLRARHASQPPEALHDGRLRRLPVL